jgi:hypothetical protein
MLSSCPGIVVLQRAPVDADAAEAATAKKNALAHSLGRLIGVLASGRSAANNCGSLPKQKAPPKRG